ncbi:MAG: glucodextranase DOMON-like domain-containing protein, partial [Candidatus Sericytochromatia bacterium]
MPRLLLASLIALGASAAPAVAAPAAEPLHVAIVWHQHQPQYPKRPGGKVYEQPWVRLHAAKDYYDMTAMALEFPRLKMTVNLTPVLLQQIEDYNAGATDRHAELAGKPATALTAAEKAEAHRRYFQVSGPMLKQFPRLAELKAKPLGSYNAQDFRDLATLFHLAWTDELFLKQARLKPLVAKGRGYSEAEKQAVLQEHRRIMSMIIPLHKKLQDQGRIEVTTTPSYHPILPLMQDTRLADEAMPSGPKPALRLQRPEDARFHVSEAVSYYKRLFGRAPRGMWPAEGSVAQDVAPLFKEAGIRWIATDEEVLARSLDLSLRDGETLTRPDVLYKPYQVQAGPAIVFRDRRLSDDIGFRYGKMDGRAAAEDLLKQLRAVARQPAREPGPKLVSIILDGENAWENYPDDGKAFLRTLYRGLTTDKAFKTVTPSEHLAAHAAKPLPRLWAGSWIGGSFATWIGEPEENAAWDLLVAAREAVDRYGKRHGQQDPGYQAAMRHLYAAEGSDWFWWYGRDQDSGRDSEFDEAYRGLLSQTYRAIKAEPPAVLRVAIVQEGTEPMRQPKGYLAPKIDGNMARLEWADAGSLFAQGGAMNIGNQKVAALFYGWDKQHLYMAVQFNGEAEPFKLAIGQPAHPGGIEQPGAGFMAHHFASVDPAADRGVLTMAGKAPPIEGGLVAAGGKGMTEIAIPWRALGVKSGETLLLSLETAGNAPFPTPPLKIQAPVLPLASLLELKDAADPGIGPGKYALPTGGAYTKARVDLVGLAVADAGDRWAFTWKLGEVANPWNSPLGLSLVTLDCYLALAEETGELTPLLPGRGAKATRPWAYAIAIEGWEPALYAPDGRKLADLPVVVDPATHEVRTFIPKKLLAGSPRDWSFLSVLSGQDGFAPGRVRKVLAAPGAEHFGGRTDPAFSQLLDALLPDALPQAQALTPAYDQVVLPYLTPGGKIEG